MLAEGTAPDFVGRRRWRGGTGAAPLEYSDHVGTPLTEGLIMVHNALVGVGLRDRVRIGASGKVATGTDVVKRLAQGPTTRTRPRDDDGVAASRRCAATPTPAR